jgi:hypothetical protein
MTLPRLLGMMYASGNVVLCMGKQCVDMGTWAAQPLVTHREALFGGPLALHLVFNTIPFHPSYTNCCNIIPGVGISKFHCGPH